MRRGAGPGLRAFSWHGVDPRRRTGATTGRTRRRFGSTLEDLPERPTAAISLPVGVFGGRADQRVRGAGAHPAQGKLTTIDPLTEPEEFHMAGFAPLVAFHTSGGTSTLPETFEGRVGECFEKTLRYPGHYDLLCELKELGLFSSEKMKFGKAEIAPRAMMSKIFEGKFASKGPDVCIMRLEAHESVNGAGRAGIAGRTAERAGSVIHHGGSLTIAKTDMSAMMRTTAFPASIVVQMLASGAIRKRGGVLQERDVPADLFLAEMEKRGIKIEYSME